MSETNPENIIEKANSEMEEIFEQPYSLSEFLDLVEENPSFASNSAKYLLEAIEHYGTRTVIEDGEEYERYQFFDDPTNNGENAILGNTPELNDFVRSLRSIASETGKTEKMLWINGPTATGKSEFKRCLIHGLQSYSKTPHGSRYTIEWADSMDKQGDPTFGNPDVGSTDWQSSPVQTNPLSVLPEEALNSFLEHINTNERYPSHPQETLDPFSQEYFTNYCDRYRDGSTTNLFESIVDSDNLRVTNYVVDVGSGIGVLNAEDIGNPKEKLVGQWMQMPSVQSKGRKNPFSFSYDGVVCQGNGVLTIVEDAFNHKELLTRLLNVIDEGEIKLDQQITLPLDTQFVIISNQDMEAFINQQSEKRGDPLKAFRRRLESHTFNYLLNYSLESKLLRRELLGYEEYGIQVEGEGNVTEPVYIETYDVHNAEAKEIAPHGIEGAAMYNILSRIELAKEVTKDGHRFDIVDKAKLLDSGVIYKGDTEYTIEDLPIDKESTDGESGIPVTYARDVITELINVKQDREHKDFNFENVIIPQDIIDEMKYQLNDRPLFSESEVKNYEQKADQVKEYIFKQQELDVLNSIMEGLETSPEKVEEYIENIYSWSENEMSDESSVISTENSDVDALSMKLFEVNELGVFSENQYNSQTHEPTDDAVTEFREKNIIIPIDVHHWESKKDNFEARDVDIESIDAFNQYLSSYGWDDVRREFEEFDPNQWGNPPEDTQTSKVKEKTIRNMLSKYNYSRESAEIVSTLVINKVSETWD